jgi:hypothetical protein
LNIFFIIVTAYFIILSFYLLFFHSILHIIDDDLFLSVNEELFFGICMEAINNKN